MNERTKYQMVNGRAVGDRVLILPHEAEEKVGILYVPESAKERPRMGTVITIGNGKLLDNGERIPLDVSVGETVYFGKHAGVEVDIEGTLFLIMREDEILFVV